MTSIISTGTARAPGTTSITIPLGSTPTVGQVVLVWLGVSSEIVTHPPGYNGTNQWTLAGSIRARNTSTLTVWRHTWNAADTGNSVVFTFSRAPTLGIGDKDLSSATALAVAAVLGGPTGASEGYPAGSYDTSTALTTIPLRQAASEAFTAALVEGAVTLASSGAGSSLLASMQDAIQCLSVFTTPTPAAGYTSGLAASSPVILSSNPNFVSGTTGWSPSGASIGVSAAVPFGGLAQTGVLTPDGVSVQGFVESNRTPVTGNTQYSAHGFLNSPTGHTAAVSINWYTSGGAYISTSVGTVTNIGVNTWTQITTTATSPSNAALATAIPIQGSTPATTDLLYLAGVYLFATTAPVQAEIISHVNSVVDGTPNIYNAPVIYEAPAADNALFYRYTHTRYYTVLNNAGVFTAIRFPTTDQLFAATKYFTNNAPVLPADYTALLNAGVGGDFRYSPTGT